MTKQDAHETLNFARIGGDVSVQAINDALLVTGDLTHYRRRDELAPHRVASQQWPYYATVDGQQETA